MSSRDDPRIAHLELAFEDGQTVPTSYGGITLRRYPIGDLILLSDRLIACDPFLVDDDPPPFAQVVVPGRYPVVLSVAHFADGDQRVAYAAVVLRAERPSRWTVAHLLEEDPDDGEGEYAAAYGVDSGTGCFMDAAVLAVLQEQLDGDDDSPYLERINQEIDDVYVDTWGWANVSLEPEIAANIVAFSTGLGDGAYLTYVGYGADDAPVCFVTDFAVLDPDADIE